MIEPTDEMGEVWEKTRRAYWAALEHDSGEGDLTLAEHEREARKQALAAVFELVERDYDVRERAALPAVCGAVHPKAPYDCERPPGHSAQHLSWRAGPVIVW